MKSAILVFPGSNCERDVAVAIERVTGYEPCYVWHTEDELPQGVDLLILPGGFSYGDYLRCGAISSCSAIVPAVRSFAAKGGYILGICNGFQILTEIGLLPGALGINAELKFISRDVPIRIERTDTPFSCKYLDGEVIVMTVANHTGRYEINDESRERLEGEGQILMRYLPKITDSIGRTLHGLKNNDIAGIIDIDHRILGMMPHPERSTDPVLGPMSGGDCSGTALFASIMDWMR